MESEKTRAETAAEKVVQWVTEKGGMCMGREEYNPKNDNLELSGLEVGKFQLLKNRDSDSFAIIFGTY